MPYLRLVADRRGVEHTYLLHTPGPGEKTRVLYWYRTAPGLRIGRPALDDAAMRMLEEQYPNIDFDWHYILDMGAMTPVEVEAPLPPRKRKARPAGDIAEPSATRPAAAEEAAAEASVPQEAAASDTAAEPDLLSELLGRGIASSLRSRHAELEALVEGATVDPAVKAGWLERLAAIDPDGWESPETVLAGMSSVERDADALRRTVEQAAGPA